MEAQPKGKTSRQQWVLAVMAIVGWLAAGGVFWAFASQSDKDVELRKMDQARHDRDFDAMESALEHAQTYEALRRAFTDAKTRFNHDAVGIVQEIAK